VAKEGWHVSSDGPDWTDIALELNELNLSWNVATSLLLETAGGRAVGSLYLCLTTRDLRASLDRHPTVAVTQAYWPENFGRPLEAFIFFLIHEHRKLVADKLVGLATYPSATRTPLKVPHKDHP